MTPDVKRLIDFYSSPLGKISRALVREEIIRLSGNVQGLRVLGLGFATPYMRFTLDRAERVLAFMPARQGSSAWPREGPSRTVLCDPLEMPLTDSAVDLIIAVHAFEHIADAEELISEHADWLRDKARIGITGGTSTPEVDLEETRDRIYALAATA